MTADELNEDTLDAALEEAFQLAFTHQDRVQRVASKLSDCWASCVTLTADDVAALLGHVDLARLTMLKARHEYLRGATNG